MCLKEMSAAKQAGGNVKTEKGKQTAVQEEGTLTTSQARTTQPASLAADADAYAAALGAVPLDDWCRTWAAGRTIKLRGTSKRVKEVVDKISPAVFRLRRRFWDDARNGTPAEKLKFVMCKLTGVTVRRRMQRSSFRALKDKLQKGLQECWRSAQRWRTLISATIG